MTFLSVSAAVTEFVKKHAVTFSLIASLSGGAFGWAMTTFALASDLERVEKEQQLNSVEIRIQELRYHIDTLTSIPAQDLPAPTKRAIDNYKLELNHLILKKAEL